MLFFITWITSRNANNESYFIGNRTSRWYIVAYGMIGASLSGVTFVSVPGDVGVKHFAYLQMVIGYMIGYAVIAGILLPLYYRLNLTSIYSYLKGRLGRNSYKTGAAFFILSRVIGASFRLYVVVNVLQTFVFDRWNIPFIVTVSVFIILILAYTFQGGVKTIVWTDTLQTTFMLLAMFLTVWFISQEMGLGLGEVIKKITNSAHTSVWVTDWHDKKYFLKHILGGAFIAIAMTGLDQEMMQKNISCKNVGESQKNMITFSIVLFFVNILFLALGALLYIYAVSKNMELPAKSDDVFPGIALNFLGPVAGIVFIIGLISAAFPSADGALTALTTSFCLDILELDRGDEKKLKKNRYLVHFGFSILILGCILWFRALNDDAVINKLFTAANFTYGPLLGLFAFGLFSGTGVKDKWVPIVAIIPPILCFILNLNSVEWLGGYQFGNEMLILNGLLTFIGLFIISKRRVEVILV